MRFRDALFVWNPLRHPLLSFDVLRSGAGQGTLGSHGPYPPRRTSARCARVDEIFHIGRPWCGGDVAHVQDTADEKIRKVS